MLKSWRDRNIKEIKYNDFQGTVTSKSKHVEFKKSRYSIIFILICDLLYFPAMAFPKRSVSMVMKIPVMMAIEPKA